ncbi:MAG: 16S rRNA (uracil(1498)-N(3))-methyltransferase [Phycisphaerales bacterium]|nr:16S rRNA (uracil(1498)-N(3))-methyltransferase [Phycisphaerales bacterium]
MAMHRVLLPDCSPAPGDRIEVLGTEGHHAARVKRLEVGAAVEVLNGSGGRALGQVASVLKSGKGAWGLTLDIREVQSEPPIRPRLTVLASAPKGPRLEEMIDQLSQAGVASWSPLRTARTIVEPGSGKLSRAERIAGESAKQCGRSWLMSIGAPVDYSDALRLPVPVVADASGAPFAPDGSEAVTLLIGPEGGWTETELAQAIDAGARISRFGAHTMRVETAAVVAAGIVLDGASRLISR